MEFFNKWVSIFIPRLMEDFDLDLLSSVAVFGNAGYESGGFKSLQEKKPVVPGSRGGYGIMQWTGPRRKDYEAYCKRNKLDPADMESNYKFLFLELKGPEGKVLPKLRAAKSLEEKVSVFMKVFLRPGVLHLDQRVLWAKRAYEAYQDSNVVPVVPSTPEKPEATPEAPVSPRKGILELILRILRIIFGSR